MLAAKAGIVPVIRPVAGITKGVQHDVSYVIVKRIEETQLKLLTVARISGFAFCLVVFIFIDRENADGRVTSLQRKLVVFLTKVEDGLRKVLREGTKAISESEHDVDDERG